MIRSVTIYLFLFLFSQQILTAQTKVTGQVFDAASQLPLIGATVVSLNYKEGIATDLKGSFTFTSTDSIISISYLGYKTKELKIASDQGAVNFDTIFLDLYPEYLMSICPVVSAKSYTIHPSISTLDKRALSMNNEVAITPSLNLVPGVLMHSGALNTNRITIRGIGNRNLFGTAKIRAFIDGIPLTSGAGETTIEDLDLSIIENVTVYKGPTSSIYGAGLGGMISLQVPNNLDKEGTSFSVNSVGGSYGLARNALDFTRANKDKGLYTINVNQTTSDGYRDNNEYQRLGITTFGKFKAGKREFFKFFGNYTFLKAEIPSSLDSMDYINNPREAAFIWKQANGDERNRKITAGAAYEAHIGKHISQITSFFANHRDSEEIRPFNILKELSLSKGLRTEWIYDNSSIFNNAFSGFQFHIGGEIFIEDYNWQTYDTDGMGERGNLISDNQEQRYNYNFFSQLKVNLNYKTSITAGFNYNYTLYDLEDFYVRNGDQSSFIEFPKVWSPFFNFGYDLSDLISNNHELSISATISHGFSPPTVEESLLPNGFINRELVPEKGWNYELGFKGHFNYKLFYGLSIYSMQINDLLVAQRTDFDQFIGINAGKSDHNGLELSLSYQQNIGAFDIQPFLNYTYADYSFDEFIDNDEDYSGNDLTGTAPHLLSVGTYFTANRFYGNILYRFVDAMPLRDDNSIYSDAYELINLKLGYKYRFEKEWELDFFFGMNNVFNKKYASMFLINAGSFGGNAPRYYYPGLPRNFYVGVKVAFGK